MRKQFYRAVKLIFLLILPFNGSAQGGYTLNQSSFIAIKFGGLFLHSSIRNFEPYSPVITDGSSLGIESAYLFNEYFGAGGSLSIMNGHNSEQTTSPQYKGINMYADPYQWRSFSISAGPYFSWMLNRVSLESKLYAGFMDMNAPVKEIYNTVLIPNEVEKVELSYSSLLLQPGVSVRLNVRNGLSATLIYDHMITFSSLSSERRLETNPVVVVRSDIRRIYQFPVLSLGFLYTFSHQEEDVSQ